MIVLAEQIDTTNANALVWDRLAVVTAVAVKFIIVKPI